MPELHTTYADRFNGHMERLLAEVPDDADPIAQLEGAFAALFEATSMTFLSLDLDLSDK